MGVQECRVTRQCAIFRLDADDGLATEVGAALRDLPDIPCRFAEECGPSLPCVDAMVFAVSGRAVPGLLERLALLRRERPGCALVVVGQEFGERQIAALFEAGAHEFLGAPVRAHELRARLRHALGIVSIDVEPGRRQALDPRTRRFIGDSPAFARQVERLPTIAGCDAGVLITGETGTGKEVFAQAIHYLSSRASRPWIAVNCGAIPVDLVESELFGHVRGAYTTAHSAREGLVAEAESGTLFLDDIDCLSLSAQSKLLRFLQEREYRVVGANAVRRADVRVIAASNRDLGDLVARGGFRQDLYFRLNVLALTLPPLRARRDDIPALASHFLEEFATKLGRRAPVLSPQALSRLLVHDWPGNVRELQHVIERSLLLARGGTLAAEDIEIPGAPPEGPAAESFRGAKDRVVKQFERSYIEHLLVTFEGNVTQAALEAKKNRRAFFELIRKHGIELQRFRPSK
jgi:two-component system response regulator GlrR